MNLGSKYQGKIATTDDVEFINKLIAENPNDGRRTLSKKVCVVNLRPFSFTVLKKRGGNPTLNYSFIIFLTALEMAQEETPR